jgi:anti-sigma-K factor RskA
VPVAAAGLVAAAVLGGVTVWTQHQLTTVQAENQAIAAVLAAPDAQFTTARTSAGGRATVVASHSAGKMVFTSVGLQVLPPSKVYELWFLRAGSARPAGLVPSAIAGRTPPVLASGLAVGDKVGVTVEPAGGSSSPTTTPIVVLTLSA